MPAVTLRRLQRHARDYVIQPDGFTRDRARYLTRLASTVSDDLADAFLTWLASPEAPDVIDPLPQADPPPLIRVDAARPPARHERFLARATVGPLRWGEDPPEGVPPGEPFIPSGD